MKIGFVSMPLSGHLNSMTALARKLQSRGHEVVFIGVPDVEPFAHAAGLNFVPICENEYPAGSIARLYGPVSKLHGLEVTRWSIRETLGELFRTASEQLPRKLNYREKARWFQKVIVKTRGLDVAADVIERAFKTTQIVDSTGESAALSRI